MILFPPAKINLGLHILRKREDGYHEIETCMLPIPFVDILEITPSMQFEFVQTGRTIQGASGENLCEKAYHLLREKYGIGPVRIHLRKQIPIGAGLGGGSSDASYTFLGLNDLFDLNLTDAELKEYAAQLGSDCPFFIESSIQMAKGRGEKLETLALNLPTMYLVLLNPGIHIGTKEAYAGVTPNSFQKPLLEFINEPLDSWQENIKNDFEQSIFHNHPILAEMKNELVQAGAFYAAMSGSGSSIYGLFLSKEKALNFSSEHLIYKGLFKKQVEN